MYTHKYTAQKGSLEVLVNNIFFEHICFFFCRKYSILLREPEQDDECSLYGKHLILNIIILKFYFEHFYGYCRPKIHPTERS